MDYLKDDPMPADKMAIKPIEQLIDDDFLAYLGQQEDSKLKAMRVYFGQMADLRKSLFTLGISLEDRISLLQGVVEFCQVMRKEFPKNAISPNLLLQLETSLHALTVGPFAILHFVMHSLDTFVGQIVYPESQ